MNNSKKIALLEYKLQLLEAKKKQINSDLKQAKKKCSHSYLIGGIISGFDESKDSYDEKYYCLSCGEVIDKTKINYKNLMVLIDVKDYVDFEEYISYKFADIFNGYYDLAKSRLSEMVINGVPNELIETTLITELVHYLEEERKKDRGR